MAGWSFQGKRALVTGAGSGLGRATALEFARRGARLVLCDISADRLGAVAAEVQAVGSEATCEVVDVADRAAMEALAERVLAQGPLDVLVNNAGVASFGSITEMPLDDWEWMLNINLGGVFYGCRLFCGAMAEAEGRAHVVNIASAAGFSGLPILGAYSVSKCAVLALSEALASESDAARLGVSVVCPGFVPTNIVEDGRFDSAPDPERAQSVARKIINRRGRSPDEVGRAIADAVERNRFLVPIYQESWGALWLRRLPPALGVTLKRRFSGRLKAKLSD